MTSKTRTRIAIAVIAPASSLLLATGCMVGPDYKRPSAPVALQYPEQPSTQPSSDTTHPSQLVEILQRPRSRQADPNRLFAESHAPSRRPARARIPRPRGIAVGEFFPQQQSISGGYNHVGLSKNDALKSSPRFYDANSVGFDATWELDAWGKFRRGIESSDASLYSSVMNYDDALVTLVADVATTYVNLRGLDERIAIAQENVRTQQQAVDIANVRFKAGGTTELDVQQAKGQLADTQSQIPALQIPAPPGRESTLRSPGRPAAGSLRNPRRTTPVPAPPDQSIVGIPADLLRRRPDIRRAEADAAAQCAQIGVAKADLFPHFSLFGSIGYSSEAGTHIFDNTSLNYQLGPSFRWDILNYGRIKNNVRVQDARFEQLLRQYQNTILSAQQDVANSVTSLVHSREQAAYLTDSTTAARRSVDLSFTQYRAGGTDFIRVLNATEFLLQEQQNLISTRVNVAVAAISLNRASAAAGNSARTANSSRPIQSRKCETHQLGRYHQ